MPCLSTGGAAVQRGPCTGVLFTAGGLACTELTHSSEWSVRGQGRLASITMPFPLSHCAWLMLQTCCGNCRSWAGSLPPYLLPFCPPQASNLLWGLSLLGCCPPHLWRQLHTHLYTLGMRAHELPEEALTQIYQVRAFDMEIRPPCRASLMLEHRNVYKAVMLMLIFPMPCTAAGLHAAGLGPSRLCAAAEERRF